MTQAQHARLAGHSAALHDVWHRLHLVVVSFFLAIEPFPLHRTTSDRDVPPAAPPDSPPPAAPSTASWQALEYLPHSGRPIGPDLRRHITDLRSTLELSVTRVKLYGGCVPARRIHNTSTRRSHAPPFRVSAASNLHSYRHRLTRLLPDCCSVNFPRQPERPPEVRPRRLRRRRRRQVRLALQRARSVRQPPLGAQRAGLGRHRRAAHPPKGPPRVLRHRLAGAPGPHSRAPLAGDPLAVRRRERCPPLRAVVVSGRSPPAFRSFLPCLVFRRASAQALASTLSPRSLPCPARPPQVRRGQALRLRRDRLAAAAAPRVPRVGAGSRGGPQLHRAGR